jgi:hypothetical protein
MVVKHSLLYKSYLSLYLRVVGGSLCLMLAGAAFVRFRGFID